MSEAKLRQEAKHLRGWADYHTAALLWHAGHYPHPAGGKESITIQIQYIVIMGNNSVDPIICCTFYVEVIHFLSHLCYNNGFVEGMDFCSICTAKHFVKFCIHVACVFLLIFFSYAPVYFYLWRFLCQSKIIIYFKAEVVAIFIATGYQANTSCSEHCIVRVYRVFQCMYQPLLSWTSTAAWQWTRLFQMTTRKLLLTSCNRSKYLRQSGRLERQW